MAQKSFYDVLAVAETASDADLKKAYRKLAREYHPDRNPDDKAAEERFKELQEAYETLSDPEKRKAYDFRRRHGGGMPGGGFSGGMGGFEDVFPRGSGGRYRANADGTFIRSDPFGAPAEEEGVFGDIFGRIFSGGGAGGSAAPPPPRARDTEAEVQLTFEEALRGGAQEFTLGRQNIRLTVPKGVPNGFKIRLRGRAPGGGDLYVRFRVGPHPRFRREGDDLIISEAVTAFEAMLGSQRTVATAYGNRLKLTIPAGTQPGERLRVRGQGVDRGDRQGDLYVEVAVTVPKLTDEQRDAVRQAAEANGLR